jgi:hypothetical protein
MPSRDIGAKGNYLPLMFHLAGVNAISVSRGCQAPRMDFEFFRVI